MATEVEELVSEKGFNIEAASLITPEMVPLAVLSLSLGDSVRMAMSINNNTGVAATKDLLAGYGALDEATGVFTIAFAHVRTAVSIITGTNTINVDCVASVQGIDFAAVAAIGAYNTSTGAFDIENILIKASQVTVKGTAVTGFSLSKV